jgi:indole-3-glycerol phosphate synthase
LALALTLKQAILGVNSRNLKTLRTDLNVARNLAQMIPSDRVAVAESGIKTSAEIAGLQRLGYRGFLIGERLLRTGQPGPALRQMMESSGGSTVHGSVVRGLQNRAVSADC